MLEDHRNLIAAEGDELLLGHCGDVFAVNDDLAAGGLDQAGQAAHHRGLAAARETHDDKRFPLIDFEGNVLKTDDVAEFSLEVGFVLVGVPGVEDFLRVLPEHLPDRIDFYEGPVFIARSVGCGGR